MQLRLRQIADFLANESDFRAGLKFVAVNFCSSGDPARLLLNRVNGSSGLSHLFSFGFHESLISLGQTHHFFTEQAQLQIDKGKNLSLIYHDNEYKKVFTESIGFSDEDKFEVTLIAQLSSEFVVSISSKTYLLDGELAEELMALGSIVNLYLNMVDKDLWNQGKSKRRQEIFPGQPLTERQELILELVRQGKRNHEIAQALGYSESLIRQETMVIYKKLGVPGRKSLTSERSDY